MVAVAVIGAAVVGAGASIASGNKAAKATTQAAEGSNQLQTQIYGENKATLAPFVAQGGTATTSINALLGLSAPTQPALSPGGAMYSNGGRRYFGDGEGYAAYYADDRPQAGGAAPALSPASAQADAFKAFRDSTGYQFQLDEGSKTVQAALGHRGMLDSGAADKSITRYAQNMADTSFSDYYARIERQQQVGLTAASAQAGVGQGYANSVSANNNAAGAAKANAALNTGNAVNSALSTGLSAYTFSQGMKSSYGGGGTYI